MVYGYYEQIIEITKDYLGPAAERFVSRQIEFYLKKQPTELTRNDIDKLAKSMYTPLMLLSKDEKLVDKVVEDVKKLK